MACGRCVLPGNVSPFLPQQTVAAFFGTVALSDGTTFTFDHKGRFHSERLDDLKAPPPPPETASTPQRQGSIDYAELRRQVSISQVLELIGWKPVKSMGGQLRGPCPIHRSERENSRIFSVNLKKNAFQCFKCGEKGNQLDLYVAVTGLPLYEVSLDLCDRLGIDVPWILEQ